MKHIVTLTISNPAHEHVSLRRRQSTTNYMVEARDEAEAIFRASNHFKKLGNYVHNAVIAESTLNEEVEQIDELSKDTLRKYVKSAEADATNKNREATKNRLVGKRSPRHADAQATADALDRARNKRLDKIDLARAKMANEEVEQIDEISDKLLHRAKMKNFDNLMFSTDSETYKKHNDRENRLYAAGDTREARRKRLGITEPKSEKKSNLFQRIKNKLRSEEVEQIDEGNKENKAKKNTYVANIIKKKLSSQVLPSLKFGRRELKKEEVEQIDELKKSTLASYITKASRQSSALHSLGKEFDNDKHKYAQKALKARTPKTKEKAKADMETSGRLAKTFTRKAQNRTAGISRAAVKLAKEEVELDEANARHSPEAAQAVLTPTAKIVRAAVGKTARDKAATKKYARRVAKISPDYSKKDVIDHLKSMGEEVQQIDEVGPQKRMTRLFNKLRDARAGDKFKRSGMPVPPPEPEHTNVAAHNKAIGRALRKEETVNEKAPPGAKYERMVKHIKDKYSADGKLTPKEKAIAYATAWKAKNAGK